MMIDTLLCCGVLILAVLARSPFLRWHINPDTGPLAYYAWFKDRGVRLGRDYPVIIGYKFALYHLFGVAFTLFGKRLRSERILAAITGLLITAGLYFFVKSAFNASAALIAAGLHAFFITVPSLEGYKTTIENYANLLILAVYALTFAALNTDAAMPYCVIVGILIALLTVYFKLTFLIECAGAIVWLWVMNQRALDLVWVCGGMVVAIAAAWRMAVSGGYWSSGLVGESLRQLFSHGVKYQKSFLFIIAKFVYFFIPIFLQSMPLWIFGLAGMIQHRASLTAPGIGLFACWVVFPALSLVVQRAFYPQMFIPIIPPLCAFAGIYLSTLTNPFNAPHLAGLVVCFGIPLVLVGKFYFSTTPGEMDRTLTFGPTYIELEQLGQYLGQRSKPEEYILQWGEFAQLNVFADRLSPFTDTFLYIHPSMDIKLGDAWHAPLLNAIKAKRPRFIVVTCNEFPDFACIRQYTGLIYRRCVDNLFFPFVVYEVVSSAKADTRYEETVACAQDGLFCRFASQPIHDELLRMLDSDFGLRSAREALAITQVGYHPLNNRNSRYC